MKKMQIRISGVDMPNTRAKVLAAVGMLIALPCVGHAQSVALNGTQVQAGKPSPLVYAYDCTRNIPISISGAAENGKVTVTTTKRNQCGHPDLEIYVLTYTSNPGFKGEDTLHIYYSGYGPAGTRKIIVK
jgi:hypothetical protein